MQTTHARCDVVSGFWFFIVAAVVALRSRAKNSRHFLSVTHICGCFCAVFVNFSSDDQTHTKQTNAHPKAGATFLRRLWFRSPGVQLLGIVENAPSRAEQHTGIGHLVCSLASSLQCLSRRSTFERESCIYDVFHRIISSISALMTREQFKRFFYRTVVLVRRNKSKETTPPRLRSSSSIV